MFVGRERELRTLRRLYEKPGFQMAVVYGRRRVGKTTLIDEFAKGKRSVLYFTAQQKSSLHNLQALSRAVFDLFGLPASTPAFSQWSDALDYIANAAAQLPERLLFIFDEFPYAAETHPALPSVLQNAIDHGFKQTNVCMILCGSNEGFMESEVLGRKSPLYGRRTAQLKVQPFDYLDAARMLPGVSAETLVSYYATFGGTPYYLDQIDPRIPYEDNVRELFFDVSGLLYEEPLMLLRQELRDPSLYNSILDAVGNGANKPKEIAEKAGIPAQSVGKYLRTLENLGIIEKVVPFGSNIATSRKGIYRLSDPLFAYWYRFVSSNVAAIEGGAGEAVASAYLKADNLAEYVGHQFERICLQWLYRQNAANGLPFLATSFGQWWGSDPSTRQETDIDAIAANNAEKIALFGECKWRNSFDETSALENLQSRAQLVKGYDERVFVLFSKRHVSEGTRRKAAERNDLMLVDSVGLFEDLNV